MGKNIKITLVSFLTVGILWISQAIILTPLGDKPSNIYVSDFFLYFYPPLIIILSVVYFFIKKNKYIAIGVIIGGLIYLFGLWFNISWDTSEMVCQRYFFNLLTNCPGIK